MPNSSASTPSPGANPLLKELKGKVLPWAQRWGMERVVVVGRGDGDEILLPGRLPTGVEVTSCKLKTKGIPVKGPRASGNRSMVTTRWPDEGLIARRTPFLIWVIGGRTDFPAGNFLIHAQEGNALCILPGTPITDGKKAHLEGQGSLDRHCDLLWLGVTSRDGLGCWVCHSDGLRHFERPMESCYLINRKNVILFDSLLEEMGSVDRSLELCHHLLMSLLLSVVRELESGTFFQFQSQMEETARYTPAEDPIQQAQDYIRSHLHRHLTTDEVAGRVYLSRAQFTKLFRQSTGRSFIEFLTECRLQEAKNLLLSTNWSVTMISRSIGLTNSRLRAIFQETMGMSPKDFRAQQLNTKNIKLVERPHRQEGEHPTTRR